MSQTPPCKGKLTQSGQKWPVKSSQKWSKMGKKVVKSGQKWLTTKHPSEHLPRRPSTKTTFDHYWPIQKRPAPKTKGYFVSNYHIQTPLHTLGPCTQWSRIYTYRRIRMFFPKHQLLTVRHVNKASSLGFDNRLLVRKAKRAVARPRKPKREKLQK